MYRIIKKLIILVSINIILVQVAFPKNDIISKAPTSAITFMPNDGRLGDRLKTYCHAKWLAYKYNLPFLCPAFTFSQDLVLGHKEQPLNQETLKQFQHVLEIKDQRTYYIDRFSNDLYYINYWTNIKEWKDSYKNIHIKMSLFNEHPEFMKMLRDMIRPVHPIEYLVLPTDKTTVALHVKRGGNFDPITERTIHPLKFLPDAFVIKYVRYLSEMLNDTPIYLHMFSDDLNPQEMLLYYKNAINKPNIEFGCRTTTNHDSVHVLDDLFNMAKFDCLIRGESSYAETSQLLGHHKIIIAGHEMEQVGQECNFIITQVCISMIKDNKLTHTILPA